MDDRIDLPPVRLVVEQCRRLCVTCRARRARVATPPRLAGAAATPFGPRPHTEISYLKTFQAFSFERLQAMLLELVGPLLSQGGPSNMIRRAQRRSAEDLGAALVLLRPGFVMASEEL
ncbi:hypothetical protein PUR29_35310 [Methylobacterium ajmalii]|uniref:Uncharacterized protein n=1 Tax=Methylobacterium ajmalii TaxID=2738439 RepID=A0ABV0A4H4_9HYPH|nr:hypothetical protein [uncultured Methylobacterium sp.]